MAKKKISSAKTAKRTPAKTVPAKKVAKKVKRKVVSSPKKQERISFEAVLESRSKIGGGHYVRVPAAVTAFFGTKGRVRVLGEMNGVEVDRALIPNGEGGHEIVVGTDVRKKTKSEAGMKVRLDIYRNPAPDEIEIPEELVEAITMEPEAMAKFARMTPGMKRNMAYWVNSGKLPETRAKRAVEILRRLMNNYPFGGRKIE